MRYFGALWFRVPALNFRRPHSTYQKVVQGKCPLHLVLFNGAVCSNTLFSNPSVVTNSLSFSTDSTSKGPRPPRLVAHFWVPILGASCSNILLLGTVRPSQFNSFLQIAFLGARTSWKLRFFCFALRIAGPSKSQIRQICLPRAPLQLDRVSLSAPKDCSVMSEREREFEIYIYRERVREI